MLSIYETAGITATIAMHIVPALDIYKLGMPQWQQGYTKEFSDILKRYSNTIDFVYTGHTHHSLVFNAEVPIIVNPAISPIFGDYPGFRYYKPHTWEDWVLDYDDYKWYKMYDFGEEYGLPEIDIPSLADKIASNDEMTLKYLINSH